VRGWITKDGHSTSGQNSLPARNNLAGLDGWRWRGVPPQPTAGSSPPWTWLQVQHPGLELVSRPGGRQNPLPAGYGQPVKLAYCPPGICPTGNCLLRRWKQAKGLAGLGRLVQRLRPSLCEGTNAGQLPRQQSPQRAMTRRQLRGPVTGRRPEARELQKHWLA